MKEDQEAELEHALARMAAEILVGEGLTDDVLRMIVGYTVTTPTVDDASEESSVGVEIIFRAF
jgi:hypothetical protein